MGSLSLERENLYKRQRVDYQPELVEIKKKLTKSAKMNKSFLPALIFAILFWSIVFVSCQLAYDYLQPVGAASEPSAFEMYVKSGIFKDSGQESAFVISLQDKIKKMLQIVLPSMSLISITLVLLSLISTVLYLFKQEFFDQVYKAKKELQEEKQKRTNNQSEGGMRGGIKRLYQGVFHGQAVTHYGLIKCYLVPNLKAWAFYEATEGPVTVVDFIKRNALKCIMMFSFCILISDQTMLELFLKGASVGTYVFKRAAEIDYVSYIDNFLTTGTDYEPYYDRSVTTEYNKYQTYNAGYAVLKDMCDRNNAYQRSTNFKTTMGQRLVDYIDSTMSNTVPFEKENFVVKAEKIDSTSYQKIMSSTGNTSSSYCMPTDALFDADSGLAGNYIRFFITAKDSASVLDGAVVQTSDVNAWNMVNVTKVEWNYANAKADTSSKSAIGIVSVASIEIEYYATYQDASKVNKSCVIKQHYTASAAGGISGSLPWTCADANVKGGTDLLCDIKPIMGATDKSGGTTPLYSKYKTKGGQAISAFAGYTFEAKTPSNLSNAVTSSGGKDLQINGIRTISINGIQYREGTYNGTEAVLEDTIKGGTDNRSTYYNSVIPTTSTTTSTTPKNP